ncbi:MAG TPA: glycosyltransferase family 4 protein, partial [Bryobacteraceae bacterium]|nr:glycosyltransferase family 4 protein [Bryobacteraceae bacterium]
KPNFLATDPGPGDGRGGYALFVGRLAEEKGIHILAEAWHRLDRVPLLVAGDGTLRGIDWPKGVAILGPQTHRQVLTLMRGARLLIFPSIWYECAPLTIIEALACGLPVIASNLGSIPEFVADRRTGLLFRPSDSEDLAAQVQWAFNHLEQIQTMRAAARREFEEKYTADRNYKMLMNIYELAIANSRRAVSRRLLKENP